MRYSYVESFDMQVGMVRQAPLSPRFLSSGLFDPSYLSSFSAPSANACFPDESFDSTVPEHVEVGGNAKTPLNKASSDWRRGMQPGPAIDRTLESLERDWLRRQRGQQSKYGWNGNRSGPPPRVPSPSSRPVPRAPMSTRATARSGGAALVATGSIILYHYSLIADLKTRLRRLDPQIQELLKKSGFRQVVCSPHYTYFNVADMIGNNDPRLFSIKVFTPPDLRNGKTSLKVPFEQFDFLFKQRPPPGESWMSAPPYDEHIYGNFERDVVPTRSRAVGFVLASAG